MDKPIIFIWILLIGLCVIVLYLMGIPEPDNVSGVIHPQFASMKQGGDALLRHQAVLFPAWVFTILALLIYVSCIFCALPAGKRGQPARRFLVVFSLLYILTWTLLQVLYSRFIENPADVEMFLGFPLPTAVLVYGMWLLPLSTVALYSYGFNRWVYSAEDEEKLRQLLVELKEPDQSC